MSKCNKVNVFKRFDAILQLLCLANAQMAKIANQQSLQFKADFNPKMLTLLHYVISDGCFLRKIPGGTEDD